MGLFRELVIEVPCAKCNALRREHVQFKTEHGDWDQVYTEGSLVDDLPKGERFDGAGIWFCAPCQGSFILDELHETFEAICAFVAQGRLVAIHPIAGKLRVEDIREIARSQVESRKSMWSTTGGWSSETWPEPKPKLETPVKTPCVMDTERRVI